MYILIWETAFMQGKNSQICEKFTILEIFVIFDCYLKFVVNSKTA